MHDHMTTPEAFQTDAQRRKDELNRALQAGIKLIEENRQYGSGPRPKSDTSTTDVVLDKLAKGNDADGYATFSTEDVTVLPLRVRVIDFVRRNWIAIIGVIMAIGMITVIEHDHSDGLVWPWQAATTELVNQPPSGLNFDRLFEPIEQPDAQQTSTVPGPAPSMEQQAPTQSGPSSEEIVIPFGALPRLAEINTPDQRGDGAHEHMSHLEPLRPW